MVLSCGFHILPPTIITAVERVEIGKPLPFLREFKDHVTGTGAEK